MESRPQSASPALAPIPLLRGVLHGAAAIVSVGTSLLLVIQAVVIVQVAAALVFGIGITMALSSSAIYHRLKIGLVGKRRLQKLDHSMIYVWVATSFIALALLEMHGWLRPLAICTIGAAALIGICVRLSVRHVPRWLLATSYIVLGWVCVIYVPEMRIHLQTAVMLVAGGLLYSLGGVVYIFKRPNPLPRVFGFHEVFHLLVVGAAACHYIALYPLISHAINNVHP